MTEMERRKAQCIQSFVPVAQGIQRVNQEFQITEAETAQLRLQVKQLLEQVERLKKEAALREAAVAQLEKDLARRDQQLSKLPQGPARAEPSHSLEEFSQEALPLQETRTAAEKPRTALANKDRKVEDLQRALEVQQKQRQQLLQEREEIKTRVTRLLRAL